MRGTELVVQLPIPAQLDAVASNVTLVVFKALDKIMAAVLSMMIDRGSVNQLPVLPLGAVVSTTKPLP